MKNKKGKTIKYIFVIVICTISLYSFNSQKGETENSMNIDGIHSAVLFDEQTNLPNQRIVEVIKERDSSKDFAMMPYCFDRNEIINDTLIVQFYTQNLIYPDNDRIDAFNFDNGVLTFSDVLINGGIIDSIVTIDKKTKKRIVSYIYTSGHVQDNTELCCAVQPSKKRTYKLVGFTEAPSIIQFWSDTLCKCPTKPIKFEIYKNDTINLLNENGLKDGVWLEFYDNGIVKEMRKYNNGKNLGGYFYNETGKAIWQINEGLNSGRPIED